MTNSHIEEFVIDYCFSLVPQNYAVLLKGPWGAGKTWFVEKLIRRIKERDGGALYVSLYGLSSFSAIEYEFYRKLHPVLSSKGMELAGKILKGALKSTLKVDLNNDGRADGSLSFSVPDVKLPDYLKNTSDLVLIFDDVERCSIELPGLLGYINHFVEHQGYKVLIVANEIELEGDGKYKEIKEKLIGKTFEITPELDCALDNFIQDTGRVEFYENYRSLIKEVYAQSAYKNLRHLRQALLDFTRLELRLPEDVTSSQDLIAHLMRLFLMFVFEIRHGKMTAENIQSLRSDWIAHAVSSKNKKQGGDTSEYIVEMLVRKYQFFKVHELLLEAEVWGDILGRSIVESEVIVAQLKNTKYLMSTSSPSWVQLWNFRSHTDSEFKLLVEEVWEQFESGFFVNLYELKHICGMMIFFFEKGLFHKDVREILSVARAGVDEIRKGGGFNTKPVLRFRDDESAFGMVYLGCESEKFKEFCEYIRAQMVNGYASTLPAIGVELMRLLPDNPELFSSKLCYTDFDSGETYYDVPVLSSIDPRGFVSALLKVKSDELYLVCRFFRERYKNSGFSGELASEREWVSAVRGLVRLEVSSRIGSLSGYCLKEVLEASIEVAIGSD